MHSHFVWRPGLVRFALLLITVVLAGPGCASRKPAVDWDARLGSYTYDQAVQELGPPDKTAQLSNGSTVAEWLGKPRSSGFSVGLGAGSYGGSGGVGVGQSVGTATTSQPVLRLTFGPDGRLVAHQGSLR